MDPHDLCAAGFDPVPRPKETRSADMSAERETEHYAVATAATHLAAPSG